jgi:hypothetical protein
MKRIMALVVLVPAVAAADPDHFVTMDRQDDSSRAGLEVSKIFYDGNNNDLSGMRFDLHGQYMTPNAVGVYATVPIGYASANNDSHTALGDIEVGAIFVPQLSASNVKLVLHGGITLPTQSKDTNPEETSIVTLWPRVTDFYLAVPEGFSLRLGVSPIIKSGQVFFRGDIGVDSNLSAASNANDVKAFVHANAGMGVDLGVASIMVESVNVYLNDNNSTWVNTGAFSARFDGGSVSPYAALIVGLDDDTRMIMDEAFTIGLEGRLR